MVKQIQNGTPHQIFMMENKRYDLTTSDTAWKDELFDYLQIAAMTAPGKPQFGLVATRRVGTVSAQKSSALLRKHANTSNFKTTHLLQRRKALASISGNETHRKELDLLTKGKIAGQAELGATCSQIGRNLNVSRTTVQTVLQRLQTTPSGVNKPRSGMPSIITPRASRALLRHVRNNPKTTWKQLKRDTDLDVSRETLLRTLKAHGISHWLALRRPHLTPEITKIRLKWAREHEHWTLDQWRKVIWSDEASVARGSGKGREWVFGTPDQKRDSDKIQQMQKGKPF